MKSSWDISDPSLSDLSGMQISVSEVLAKYDDPILFTSRIGFETYLILNVDDHDDGYIMVASSVTPEALSLLKNNKLSILGALRSGDFIVIDCSDHFVVNRYWPIEIDQFDQELLPESGAALSLQIEGVADTIDQAKSYFSIRLSGGELGHETMGFHQFKKMVDNAYIVARKILAPAEIKASKSQVYDFKITEPEFGSLIINIESPQLPRSEVLSRYFKDGSASADIVSEKFSNVRGRTLTNLQGLKKALESGNLDDETISNFSLLIRDISGIFPDRRDLYSDIEFSGELNGSRKTMRFSGDETAELIEAHRKLYDRPQNVTGVISIINEGTHNVVIKVLGTNEVRCNFSRDDFEEMKESPFFQTGNILRAHGVIFSRSRRDIMNCDGAAEIFEADEGTAP